MKTHFSSRLRSREHRARGHRQYRQSFRPDHQRKKQKYENADNITPKNPIQNQFTILSNQRDTFMRERQIAEKELFQIKIQHPSIKKQHHDLLELNRSAKQDLGQKMESLFLLNEEESRLKRFIDNEFKAIQHCTKHSNKLEQKRVRRSKKYTTKMDALNFEVAALLKRRIQKKTAKCISIRSIEAVVLPELENNNRKLLRQKEELAESIKTISSASSRHQELVDRLSEPRQASSGLRGDLAHRERNHVDLFYGDYDIC